jgi:hypothetical protein
MSRALRTRAPESALRPRSASALIGMHTHDASAPATPFLISATSENVGAAARALLSGGSRAGKDWASRGDRRHPANWKSHPPAQIAASDAAATSRKS